MAHLDMLQQAFLSGCQSTEPEPVPRHAGGRGRAGIPRLPKSLGPTGGGRRGSGFFSGPRHRPLLCRLLVAYQPPVAWGQGSWASPSGVLCSNAQESGVRPCVGPGCVFHMLLALGGRRPGRGWPVTCRGRCRKGCGGRCPAPAFRAKLAPQARSPAGLPRARHCHPAHQGRGFIPENRRGGEGDAHKEYTQNLFSVASEPARGLGGGRRATPWAPRTPSSPPAGPS